MDVPEFVREHQHTLLLLAVAAAWFLLRATLKAFTCQGALCWLEPADWPILLNFQNPLALYALIFLLFALPFGWSSVLGTIVGIQLGLEHEMSVTELSALFFLATAISTVLTWKILELVLDTPSHWMKTWTQRVKTLYQRLAKIKKNSFWMLSVGNAVSSQLYMTAAAILLKIPKTTAYPALVLGSLLSFLVPLVLLFSAKALSLDRVTAALLVAALFLVAQNAYEKTRSPVHIKHPNKAYAH